MKSVLHRFSYMQKKRPDASSLLNYAATVKQLRISKSSIRRWFSMLVEEGDYDPSDKCAILRYLYSLAGAEEHQNSGQICR